MKQLSLWIMAALAAFGAFLVVSHNRKVAAHANQQAEIKANGEKYQRFGVTTEAEYVRLRNLEGTIKASGVVSDKDLDYLIDVIHTADPSSKNPGFSHLHAAADLTLVRKFEPGQRQKVIKAVTPLFSSKNASDQRGALAVAEALKDKWVVPLVVPLLGNSHENIREHAKLYLEEVGYRRKA